MRLQTNSLVLSFNPKTKTMKKLFFIALIALLSCESKKETIADEPKKEEIKGSWQVRKIVDEFGDEVKGKSTIVGDFEGKMSNSAVSDAKLIARLQVQDSSIYTMFYEYGNSPQATLPKGEISIKIKLFNGDVLNVKQYLYENMMVDNDKELFKILTTQDKPVKAVVDLSRAKGYSNEVYSYEIDPAGLKGLL